VFRAYGAGLRRGAAEASFGVEKGENGRPRKADPTEERAGKMAALQNGGMPVFSAKVAGTRTNRGKARRYKAKEVVGFQLSVLS
jgi:hypothetical protein